MFNICAADKNTVVYAAGSYIIMFDINEGKLNFRKCAGNGGIGHIAVSLLNILSSCQQLIEINFCFIRKIQFWATLL